MTTRTNNYESAKDNDFNHKPIVSNEHRDGLEFTRTLVPKYESDINFYKRKVEQQIRIDISSSTVQKYRLPVKWYFWSTLNFIQSNNEGKSLKSEVSKLKSICDSKSNDNSSKDEHTNNYTESISIDATSTGSRKSSSTGDGKTIIDTSFGTASKPSRKTTIEIETNPRVGLKRDRGRRDDGNSDENSEDESSSSINDSFSKRKSRMYDGFSESARKRRKGNDSSSSRQDSKTNAASRSRFSSLPLSLINQSTMNEIEQIKSAFERNVGENFIHKLNNQLIQTLVDTQKNEENNTDNEDNASSYYQDAASELSEAPSLYLDIDSEDAHERAYSQFLNSLNNKDGEQKLSYVAGPKLLHYDFNFYLLDHLFLSPLRMTLNFNGIENGQMIYTQIPVHTKTERKDNFIPAARNRIQSYKFDLSELPQNPNPIPKTLYLTRINITPSIYKVSTKPFNQQQHEKNRNISRILKENVTGSGVITNDDEEKENGTSIKSAGTIVNRKNTAIAALVALLNLYGFKKLSKDVGHSLFNPHTLTPEKITTHLSDLGTSIRDNVGMDEILKLATTGNQLIRNMQQSFPLERNSTMKEVLDFLHPKSILNFDSAYKIFNDTYQSNVNPLVKALFDSIQQTENKQGIRGFTNNFTPYLGKENAKNLGDYFSGSSGANIMSQLFQNAAPFINNPIFAHGIWPLLLQSLLTGGTKGIGNLYNYFVRKPPTQHLPTTGLRYYDSYGPQYQKILNAPLYDYLLTANTSSLPNTADAHAFMSDIREKAKYDVNLLGIVNTYDRLNRINSRERFQPSSALPMLSSGYRPLTPRLENLKKFLNINLRDNYHDLGNSNYLQRSSNKIYDIKRIAQDIYEKRNWSSIHPELHMALSHNFPSTTHLEEGVMPPVYPNSTSPGLLTRWYRYFRPANGIGDYHHTKVNPFNDNEHLNFKKDYVSITPGNIFHHPNPKTHSATAFKLPSDRSRAIFGEYSINNDGIL